ncbi:MAG: sulfotransferase [Phycisphaeraceae bacterium]|nr:sulfotransferase [Phycisphaeraceae bacterium]
MSEHRDESGPGARPTLRLWHNLARSGSTMIGRCLGCMRGVCLLSEIHPLGARYINPFGQANEWFGLFSPEDVARLGESTMGYAELMLLIRERAERKGLTLVIRSWEHIDFYGPPFLARAPMRAMNVEHLAPVAELVRVATVRHPIDQWMSLSALPIMKGCLNLEHYLRGYREFVEKCLPEVVIRYEDFTRNPDAEMARMCAALGVEFDATYKERWADYATITGDVVSSRGLEGRTIRPMGRREVVPTLIAKFAKNADYQVVIKRLGYGHPV